MSRKLQRLDAFPVPGGGTDYLTCPAGHKYELVAISFGNDFVNTYNWRVFIHSGGNLLFLDFVPVAAPPYVVPKLYGGTPWFEGESLQLYPTSAGATARLAVVTYVDVEF